MSFGPKKDGSPNVEYFQQPDVLAGLETVRLWLQKNFKKVSFFPCQKDKPIAGRREKCRQKIICFKQFFFYYQIFFLISVRSSGKFDQRVFIPALNSVYATSRVPTG